MVECPNCKGNLKVSGTMITEYHDAEVEFEGTIENDEFKQTKLKVKGSYYLEDIKVECMECRKVFDRTILGDEILNETTMTYEFNK